MNDVICVGKRLLFNPATPSIRIKPKNVTVTAKFPKCLGCHHPDNFIGRLQSAHLDANVTSSSCIICGIMLVNVSGQILLSSITARWIASSSDTSPAASSDALKSTSAKYYGINATFKNMFITCEK